MRRVLPPIVIVTATLSALVAGCSDDTGSGSGPATGSEPVAAVTTVAADDVREPARRASLGQPLTLAGLDDGVSVRVVAAVYQRDVEGASELDVPGRGNRFDAVQLRITNTGTGDYDDAPSNGARATDSAGRQYEAEPATETKAGADFPNSKLKPGQTATGWAVFRLPATVSLKAIQFTTDSGFGDTGEWATP